MPVAEFAEILLQVILSVFAEIDPLPCLTSCSCRPLDCHCAPSCQPARLKKCKPKFKSLSARFISYVSISILIILIILIRSVSNERTGTAAATATSTIRRTSSTNSITPLTVESIANRNDGFSGCLVLKDDNDRLSEWIAYHYLTLPLKYLIVAVDPTGKTTPRDIVNVWNGTNTNESDDKIDVDLGVEILLWDDADYGHWIDEEMDDIHKHRHRQKTFLAQCQKYHKARNRTWIALVDPDEYITYNILSDDDRDPERRNDIDTFSNIDGPNFKSFDYRVKMQNLREEMTVARNNRFGFGGGYKPPPLLYEKTVFDYIKEHQNEEPWNSEPCYLMMRTIFSAIESPPHVLRETGGAEYGLDPKSFSTLRYYKHGEKGSWYDNRFGKVIIDISRIDGNELNRYFPNVHTPLDSCHYPFRLYETSILRVHHYLGSWEQYSSRADVRRTREKFDDLANVNFGADYQMQGWLKRFVELVGAKNAKILLQHSGKIDVGSEDMLTLMEQPEYGYVKVEPPSARSEKGEEDEEEEGEEDEQAKELEIDNVELLYYYENGKLDEVKVKETGEKIALDDPRLMVNQGKKNK